MGLLDRLLGRNNTVVVPERTEVAREKVDATKEIDDILDVLSELGLMDAYSIEKELDRKKVKYDKSILYRLMIDIDERAISELKRYISSERLGYGQNKLDEIKKRLEDKVRECNEQGRSRIETIEELISIAKEYISDYQAKLYAFNNTIRTIKENSDSEAEVIAMIAYWIDYYKEQEFGFPIDLDKKLREMAAELRNLPDGGYGDEKIKEFMEAAKAQIEEGKKHDLSDSDIVQKIISTLVTQYKNRYLYDANNLAKRIQTIEASTFIDEEEKQKNIAELRIDFNNMYGHNVNIGESIKEMLSNLEKLEFGGYGKPKLEDFETLARRIVEDGHAVGKEDKAILAKIEIEYHKLLDEYNRRKAALEEELAKVDESDMTEKEKAARKKRLKDDFKADSGHKVDLKKKVKEMIETLQGLERGGYGAAKVREFKVQCEKILTTQKEKATVLEIYRQIQAVYDRYINDYERRLRELKATHEQIDNNRSLSAAEKEAAKAEFDVDFELMAGRSIDLKKRVEEYTSELRGLPHGGYGQNAIVEFENYCLDVIGSDRTEREKYSLISQKVRLLMNRYNNNLGQFEAWKKDRLKKYMGSDKEGYERELNDKVTFMLSLSQSELEAYYKEDDRQKKAEFMDHNTEVAVKHLAKKEAKKAKDDKLYYRRLEEFHNGNNPYTQEQIDGAIDDLRKLALFSDEEPEDEIMDPVVYIDSTLYKQMAGVTAPPRRR